MTDGRPLVADDIRALEAIVGADITISLRPYVEYATVDAMRNFARAYGDDNPLFGDESYGASSPWGSIVAPPLFPIATGAPVPCAPDAARQLDRALAGTAMEVIYDRWHLLRVIPPGIRLERTNSISAVKPSERDGLLVATVTTRSVYRSGGEVYAINERVRDHGARSISDATEPREGRTHYDDGTIADIDALYAAQRRRGATGFPPGEPARGQSFGPIVKGPLTITDLVAYRGGVGPGPFGVEPLGLAVRNRRARPGFYDRDAVGAWDARERLHWDVGYARQCGHPSAYDYTHTRLNWMVHLLTDWIGDAGRLALISFSHLAHNYVGDTHWINGTVTTVDESDKGRDITVDVRAVNQLGLLTCRATATLALPR
ncbi:MAG TPA: MaoC family dehydratase N-terminal domain-containing protein [Acidimicrobiales bacterium]|nr:MaoC family dehydratase N-terminal domain-containing protein [Acidimicrobiales bacterium]